MQGYNSVHEYLANESENATAISEKQARVRKENEKKRLRMKAEEEGQIYESETEEEDEKGETAEEDEEEEEENKVGDSESENAAKKKRKKGKGKRTTRSSSKKSKSNNSSSNSSNNSANKSSVVVIDIMDVTTEEEDENLEWPGLIRVKTEIKTEPSDESTPASSSNVILGPTRPRNQLGVMGTRTRKYRHKVSYTTGTGMEDDDHSYNSDDSKKDGNFSEHGGEDEDENELKDYEVERILGQTVIDNEVSFFVKWKGYPNSSNTWVSESNLNCPELIRNYFIEIANSYLPKANSASASTLASTSVIKKEKVEN